MSLMDHPATARAAVIVGAGPGIGAAVARRFAAEGLPVGLVARSRATLATVRRTLPADARSAVAPADAADEAALRRALDLLAGELGDPGALIYNAGVIRRDRAGELTARELQATWAVNVGGAVVAAAHVAPRMAAVGRGTILLTGGMPAPDPEHLSLSLGKAALRALAGALDAQFGPAGVHVATVTVGGAVAPGTALDPDRIAERYWALHAQPPGWWQREVLLAT